MLSMFETSKSSTSGCLDVRVCVVMIGRWTLWTSLTFGPTGFVVDPHVNTTLADIRELWSTISLIFVAVARVSNRLINC